MKTPQLQQRPSGGPDDRLVRLCRFCAQKLDLWVGWKSNHYLYDHATSMPCDECQGANLRNPESIFTVKLRLPNAEPIYGRN